VYTKQEAAEGMESWRHTIIGYSLVTKQERRDYSRPFSSDEEKRY
jgi:hypothetical protein